MSDGSKGQTEVDAIVSRINNVILMPNLSKLNAFIYARSWNA